MAAGFRHTELTPLHAALIIGAVAKDGELPSPRFVTRLHGPKGETIEAPTRGPIARAMKPETARSQKGHGQDDQDRNGTKSMDEVASVRAKGHGRRQDRNSLS